MRVVQAVLVRLICGVAGLAVAGLGGAGPAIAFGKSQSWGSAPPPSTAAGKPRAPTLCESVVASPSLTGEDVQSMYTAIGGAPVVRAASETAAEFRSRVDAARTTLIEWTTRTLKSRYVVADLRLPSMAADSGRLVIRAADLPIRRFAGLPRDRCIVDLAPARPVPGVAAARGTAKPVAAPANPAIRGMALSGQMYATFCANDRPDDFTVVPGADARPARDLRFVMVMEPSLPFFASYATGAGDRSEILAIAGTILCAAIVDADDKRAVADIVKGVAVTDAKVKPGDRSRPGIGR